MKHWPRSKAGSTILLAALCSTLLVFALQAVAITLLGRLLYDWHLPAEWPSLLLAFALAWLVDRVILARATALARALRSRARHALTRARRRLLPTHTTCLATSHAKTPCTSRCWPSLCGCWTGAS